MNFVFAVFFIVVMHLLVAAMIETQPPWYVSGIIMLMAIVLTIPTKEEE